MSAQAYYQRRFRLHDGERGREGDHRRAICIDPRGGRGGEGVRACVRMEISFLSRVYASERV